jgi:hypothetical protein
VGPEDNRGRHDPQPARGHGGVDAGGHNGLAGELLEFIESRSRHPGVGEVNNEFVPGQLGDDTAADYIEGPDVGVCHEAPDLYLCRLLDGVYADEHPDARIPVGGMGVIRTGMTMSRTHKASELPHRVDFP